MGDRSDKKVQVAPHVLPTVAEAVHDIRVHLGSDQVGVIRLLLLVSAQDYPTLNKLSPYFWRTLEGRDTVWPGHRDYVKVDDLVNPRGKNLERIYTRMLKREVEPLDDIAFALGAARAHAAAALLTLAVRDLRMIHLIAPQFEFRSAFSLQKGCFQWDSGVRR